MTSIERTAYPRFKRLISAGELHGHFKPTREEVSWASQRTDSDGHLLALVLALKCFQWMGRFPQQDEVPGQVVDYVRRALKLPGAVVPVVASDRSAERHRGLIRTRCGVSYNPAEARRIAAEAIRAEAEVKNNPADLINVALEKVLQATLELPAYRTLDELASQIRGEVNREIITRVHDRMNLYERGRLEASLSTIGLDGKTLFNAFKQAARRPSWSHFRQLARHLVFVDGYGDTETWLDGVAPAKVASFAGEADAADAAVMGDYERTKRIVLIACLLHKARMRARDDMAAMFCKRVATHTKKARDELEDIRRRQQSITERLVLALKAVLGQVDPGSPAAAMGATASALAASTMKSLGARKTRPGAEVNFTFSSLSEASGPAVAALLDAIGLQATGMGLVRQAVEKLGGFEDLYADIELVAAHHGDNFEMLVARHMKTDRSTMFELTERLELVATSEDRKILDALAHAERHREMTRDYISAYDEAGRPLDTSFATGNWHKALGDRGQSGQLHRRHFEACVFTYLAEELRTGDVAVAGADEYADWSEQLLPWEECEALLPQYLIDVGLRAPSADGAAGPGPYTAVSFREQLEDLLTKTAAIADAGYPTNDDLVIDGDGTPHLKRRRREDRRASSLKLEAQIKARLPERSLLGILARTAYWIEWWRRFGPASGSDPKIKDPFGRYVLATFVYGINMSAADAARHIAGTSARDLALVANRHVTVDKLNEAITDVVNAYARLDLIKAWGDGSSVAADGTHMDTYLDNLLAETSIRYGASGGIAYHHISDHYIALFTHFVPCGVWEAVYIIEGLLKNASEIQPTTIHADTQGQSLPVFTMAHLMGFDLMPRIRQWQDLIFWRPSTTVRYEHIDALFGTPGRNVIDWDLIETHFKDLMQIAISIREGSISSSVLLRRLRSGSRRNATYAAFREVGQVIRTVQLLRFLSDGSLRRRVTAATNKVEAFNNFCQWLFFGKHGVIADNDPDEQEKTMKFNALLSNCVIFHTTLELTEVIRQLQAEGWSIDAADLAEISPYITEPIRRFGEYSTDELGLRPAAFDPNLDVDFDPLTDPAPEAA